MSDEEFQNWLEASQIDEQAARSLFQVQNFPACVFHCQQAVEKLLKALIARSGKIKFTHSLVNLCEIIEECTGSNLPANIREAMNELDFHYAASRYPGTTALGKLYSEKKAEEALGWMQTSLSYLKSLNMK